jgi:hypothetical protein
METVESEINGCLSQITAPMSPRMKEQRVTDNASAYKPLIEFKKGP